MVRRKLRAGLPWIVALTIASTVHAQPGQSPLQGRVLKEYRPSLKEGNNERYDLKGPDAEQCVKFEPTGLRITLPAGFEGSRPETGLRIAVDIRGDFEITASFEVLQEPEPRDAGFTTRAMLGVWMDGPEKQRDATMARVRNASNETKFSSWAPTLTDDFGNKVTRHKFLPTEAKAGRLRMVRVGKDVSYHAAEEKGEFTQYAKFTMADGDVKRVRLLGTTGGPKAALDIRFTDLVIRAESFPDLPAEAQVNPGGVVANPTAPGSQSNLVIVGILIGAVFLVFLLAGLGALLVLRRRLSPTAPENEAALIMFDCAGCERKIGVKPELVGRKVKCAKCGTIVRVPDGAEQAAS